MNRRQFLYRLPACGASAATLMSATNPVQAQSGGGGYRALVCVFLYGGNDGLNMLPPIATHAYQRYASVRGRLALAQSDIIALDADHGLHPNLAALRPVWDENRLASILNVGPLARPLSQADYFAWRDANDVSRVPESLFSHADQQTLWETATATKTSRTGWGARVMEALSGVTPVVSISGNSRFGIGASTQSLVLPVPGRALELNGYGNNTIADARRVSLNALVGASSSSLLQRAYSGVQTNAFDVSARLSSLLKQAPQSGAADSANPELSAAFGHLTGAMDNGLARQLYQVAKLIKHQASIGGNRHLFFVSLGGFDHHENQSGPHAALMKTLGDALAAFYNATKAIGMADAVTAFTESDFGRTFKPNSSAGTDHAWGNHHLVVGGAVRGGTHYGYYPSLILGGPDDAGRHVWEHQGRWIPSLSVDQYAATLAAWFAPELIPRLTQILPNLSRFAQHDLGFLNA